MHSNSFTYIQSDDKLLTFRPIPLSTKTILLAAEDPQITCEEIHKLHLVEN